MCDTESPHMRWIVYCYGYICSRNGDGRYENELQVKIEETLHGMK